MLTYLLFFWLIGIAILAAFAAFGKQMGVLSLLTENEDWKAAALWKKLLVGAVMALLCPMFFMGPKGDQ